MSVAVQCLAFLLVGIVIGVALVVVVCERAGFKMVSVKPGSTFALVPGDVVLIRKAVRG